MTREQENSNGQALQIEMHTSRLRQSYEYPGLKHI